jgi:8-oxo-dGTP pyrophosphatase MutT (NUDIX family)
MDTTCGLFLINNKREIVLGHPINSPYNFWSIPKGLIEVGESFLKAALRETFEETNIKLDINSKKIKKILEFDMIRYKKTKKQLKSYAIIIDDDFSGIDLKCTSTFVNKKGEIVPENNKVQWFPLNLKNDPEFSYIQ